MGVLVLNVDLLPAIFRTAPGRLMAHLVVSLRPRQWLKNAFVFPALFFSRSLLIPGKAVAATELFLIFCLLSGSVYLVNDVADREQDQRHPRKCRRPVAAGLISPGQVTAAAVILGALSLGWAFRLGVWVGALGAAYTLQNLLYSFWLKQVVLVDVFVVALGFVIRVLAGGVVIDTPISPWLLTTTILLALFLALAKRRHEVTSLDDPRSHRSIYALYTFLVSRGGSLVYTVPFVLFGMFRYLYLIHRRQGGGEPEVLVVKDWSLLVTMALWAGTTFYILYVLNG